jgi:hypothetical protein
MIVKILTGMMVHTEHQARTLMLHSRTAGTKTGATETKSALIYMIRVLYNSEEFSILGTV